MWEYEIADVADYCQPILERIEELFDAWVVVDDYDDEWVQFHIPSLVDRYVIVAIEKNNKQILIGDERWSFQVLCPWSSAGGSGLWLHYLADPVAQAENFPGVWFYGS